MINKNPALIVMLILFLNSGSIYAQTQETRVPETSLSMVRVEAINVCMGMGTNRVFARELMPAVVDGKTYYGCCEGCQAKLLEDSTSRVALDPVSGNEVDKSSAIIGALSSGTVYYFENEKNMHEFAESISLQE